MKKILYLLVILVSLPVAAESAKVKVTGMVCDFCARGVEKSFKGRDDIEKINVSLEDSLVEIQLKEKSILSDEEIRKVITDNGLSVISIERVSGKSSEKSPAKAKSQ